VGPGSTSSTHSTTDEGAPRCPTCPGAPQLSSITTCSGLTTRRVCNLLTIADGFNGFAVHLANSRRHACGGVAGPLASCRRISGGWGGVSPGVIVRQRFQRRLNAHSRGPTARGASNQTTARAAVAVTQR